LNNRILALILFHIFHVEIKCQLDETDDIYCRFYCLLDLFRAPLCPSSGAREYYTAPDDGHNGTRNMLSKQ